MELLTLFQRRNRVVMVQPWGLVVPQSLIRVVLGALLINHGVGKVFNGTGKLGSHLAELGWPLPHAQAFLAGYTEFLGGVLLIVGLFTRLSAALNVGLFTIIVFVYHYADAFADKEAGLLFLLLSLTVLFMGPGKISVDNFVFTKNEAPVRG